MTVNLLKMLKITDKLKDSLNEVQEMHSLSLEMFNLAWESIEAPDEEKSRLVIGKDEKVDHLEVQVRENVLKYLAGMPVGGNVPLSLVLIDTANNLERIADHICFMADSAIKYPCLTNDDEFSQLLMAEKELSYTMLKKTSTALDMCNEETAEEVIGMHNELINLYEKIVGTLDSSDLDLHRAIGIVLVSRNLLRIGKKSKSIMEFCLKPYPEAGD